MAEPEQIFPEIKIFRTPRIVSVICECVGDVASRMSATPITDPITSNHIRREVDPRPAANEVVN